MHLSLYIQYKILWQNQMGYKLFYLYHKIQVLNLQHYLYVKMLFFLLKKLFFHYQLWLIALINIYQNIFYLKLINQYFLQHMLIQGEVYLKLNPILQKNPQLQMILFHMINFFVVHLNLELKFYLVLFSVDFDSLVILFEINYNPL